MICEAVDQRMLLRDHKLVEFERIPNGDALKAITEMSALLLPLLTTTFRSISVREPISVYHSSTSTPTYSIRSFTDVRSLFECLLSTILDYTNQTLPCPLAPRT